MLKKVCLFIFAGIMAASMVGCSKKADKAPVDNEVSVGVDYQFSMPEKGEDIAVIKTNMGDITVRFFPNEAPKAVENFITHAKDGYYDGVIFHRVINDFMIQGGDSLGTGTGGESIWGEAFEDEFSPKLHNFRGALSMANAGANTNGSQFFIVQAKDVQQKLLDDVNEYKKEIGEEVVDVADDGSEITFNDVYSDETIAKYQEVGGAIHLDYAHTVFGQVIDGMDVVDAIAAVNVEPTSSKPIEDVVIETIEIKPYE